MPNLISRRFWRHIKPEQYVSLCITSISALQAIIFALWTGVSIASYVSLVVGTTFAIISDRIGRYIFENNAIRKLTFMQYTNDSLECIGGLKQGIDWLLDNLDGAVTVRNTVFTRSERHFTSVDSKRLDELTLAVENCLKGECFWRDAYMPSESDVINQFVDRLNEPQRRFYEPVLIDTNIPMFQYTTIHYKNNNAAVVFGWSYAGGKNEKARVFMSRSGSTVDFFSEHFDHLIKSGTPNLKEPTRRPFLPPLSSIEPKHI